MNLEFELVISEFKCSDLTDVKQSFLCSRNCLLSRTILIITLKHCSHCVLQTDLVTVYSHSILSLVFLLHAFSVVCHWFPLMLLVYFSWSMWFIYRWFNIKNPSKHSILANMAEENCSGKTLWDTVLSKRILVHLRKWVFHPDVSKSGAFQYIIRVLHNNRFNTLIEKDHLGHRSPEKDSC